MLVHLKKNTCPSAGRPNMINIIKAMYIISEKKVLPSLVLTSFIIYFVVAIVFYYKY